MGSEEPPTPKGVNVPSDYVKGMVLLRLLAGGGEEPQGALKAR